MGQAVSHSRDLSPRKIGLPIQEVGRKRFHGLANFDQPYADSIEDQRIGEIAAGQVSADRFDGRQDVFHALPIASDSQRSSFSERGRRHCRFEIVGGYQIHLHSEQSFQVSLATG
jgi:hypothetical protein